jgi:hypothetical protein
MTELADYRKIHEHCNVPKNYSENTKLAYWVAHQRQHYKLHLQGKRSSMTLPRIQELESLGFEWNGHGTVWDARMNELADYRKIHGHCNAPQNYSENTKLATWNGHGAVWDAAGDARMSELTVYRKIHGHCNVPRRYSKNTKLGNWVSYQRQRYKLHLEGEKSSMTLPRIQELESLGFEWTVRHPPSLNSLSHATLSDAVPPESSCLVAAKKPANSLQHAEKQRQRHKGLKHARLLEDGPQDEFFHIDSLLNEVEMQLIWLGEESMYCLVCPDFQFDYIYENAPRLLKVELRKLSRDDQSETGILKHIVRMDDWRVSRHFDFTRKDIRLNYF